MRFFRLPGQVAGALLVLTGVAACGRDTAPTLPGDRIRETLSVLPEDSVIQLATGDTLHVSKATTQFYKGRRGRAAWAGEDGLLERGEKVLTAIEQSASDGLSPVRYRNDVAQRLRAEIAREGDGQLSDSVRSVYLADLDLIITEGFNRYANDLVRGTLDPEEAGLKWEIPRGAPNEERVLNGVIKGTEPGTIVEHLRPTIPHYDRLRAALAEYREVETAGGWPQVPDGVEFKEGLRHPAVGVLRQRLAAGPDSTEMQLAKAGAADPTLMDANLVKAIENFQERHGIEADGAVGAKTLEELNHSPAERIAEIEMNLDRWRWLPDDLGERYVLVNIAGFELEVVEENKIIERMNVVVGKPSWATPVMADTMEHIVVNPYWNVPESIANDEVIPALQRDPGYLARNNMEFVDGRYRQRPGPRNALGQFKFLFPNKYNVYLHDTPHDQLFSRTRRDFSHGCIRLERPRDFAELLFRLQTRKDPSDIDELLATGSEQWVKIRKLPVYLLYLTALADEDGDVHFYHDIYGSDETLAEQQNRTAGRSESLPKDRVEVPRVGDDPALSN